MSLALVKEEIKSFQRKRSLENNLIKKLKVFDFLKTIKKRMRLFRI